MRYDKKRFALLIVLQIVGLLISVSVSYNEMKKLNKGQN